MRLRATIICLFLLGQLSCSTEDIDGPPPEDGTSTATLVDDDPSITTLNGTWKVYFYENFNTRTAEFKTEKNSWGQDIIVEFSDPNGFSGIKTTNTFGGEFEYVGTRQFKLKQVITTLAGQPWWADEFDKIIREGYYKDLPFVINDKMLCIYYDNKTKSVTLTKQ